MLICIVAILSNIQLLGSVEKEFQRVNYCQSYHPGALWNISKLFEVCHLKRKKKKKNILVYKSCFVPIHVIPPLSLKIKKMILLMVPEYSLKINGAFLRSCRQVYRRHLLPLTLLIITHFYHSHRIPYIHPLHPTLCQTIQGKYYLQACSSDSHFKIFYINITGFSEC